MGKAIVEARFTACRKHDVYRSAGKFVVVIVLLFILCAVYHYMMIPSYRRQMEVLQHQVKMGRQSKSGGNYRWYQLHQKRLKLLKWRHDAYRIWYHDVLHLFEHQLVGIHLGEISWHGATKMIAQAQQLDNMLNPLLMSKKLKLFGGCRMEHVVREQGVYQLTYRCKQSEAAV